MNEPTSTDNYVQIGDRVINRTIDASVTTDDVSLNDRVFVFKKNDDGSIKTVVNTTIQYVVDAFGADAVATKNEVTALKNDVVTLKEQAVADVATYKSDTESARDKALQYRNEAEQLSKSLCYFRKQSYSISASAGATDITIPSEAQYRNLADILIVHNKGVALAEGTEYTKTSTGITLTTALTSATTIEIDILRAVSTDSQSYDLLKGDKGDKGDDGLYSKSQLLDMIYPVGAIYTSLVNTSPASTLGGTWTAIEGDRVLWSVTNGNEDLVDSNGNPLTGGSSSHSHTITVNGHTLTVNEIPAHGHNSRWLSDAGTLGTAKLWNDDGQTLRDATSCIRVNSSAGNWNSSTFTAAQNGYGDIIGKTDQVGGGGSHSHGASSGSASNIPPYIKVYMWRRTA